MDLVFVEWNDFCTCAFEEYNIQGYYVYGNGQTSCCFGIGDPKISRVPRSVISSKFGIGFPSLSVIESPLKLLSYLIEAKIVKGTFKRTKAKTLSKSKLRENLDQLGPGWRYSSGCLKYPNFRRWRLRIKDQCDQIREDAKSFRNESHIDEVTDEMKSNMRTHFYQLHEDPELFERAALRAMREIITEHVMDV